MFRMVYSFLFILFSQSAFAQETAPVSASQQHPQFFFQASEGNSVLTPEIAYATASSKFVGDDEVSNNIWGLAAAYEYGLYDTLALGAKLAFEDVEMKTTGFNGSSSGLTDIEIYLRSFSRFESLNLRYGVDLSISPENQRYEEDGSRGNRFSGANIIKPYIGLDVPLDNHVLGAKFSHELLLGKQVYEDFDGSEIKLTGGTETQFDVFYEYSFSEQNLLGLSISYMSTADHKNDAGGTSENIKLYQLRYYSAHKLADDWTLLPYIEYQTVADKKIDGDELESADAWILSIAARYTF